MTDRCSLMFLSSYEPALGRNTAQATRKFQKKKYWKVDVLTSAPVNDNRFRFNARNEILSSD